MARNITAVFPGTFDPMTLGHMEMVRRAALMFDQVIVAVAAAHHKKTLFSLSERLDMMNELVKPYPQVRVESLAGLVVEFAHAHKAQVLVRGVRSVTDFDFEAQLAGMNRNLAPDLDTVFLTPGSQHQFVSSTLVREIARLGGNVTQFVDPLVARSLSEKLRGTSED